MDSQRTVDWRRELRHNWPMLRVQHGSAISTAPLPRSFAGAAILVGVDADGTRHLLVPLGGGQPVEDRRSAHLQVSSRELVIADERRAYVDVRCHRADLADLFDDILADMLEELHSADDAGLACMRALDRWRELLRRRSGTLSESAARGLYAELLVLDKLLSLDPALHVPSVWTGPTRTPHDFELVGHSLEVKAIGDGPPLVEIHGIEQLSSTENKDLHLVVVRLREDVEGRRVPDLAADLLDKVSVRHDLLEQLARAGFSPAATDATAFRRYAVVETLVLPVVNAFPRIVLNSFVSGELPNEVTDVSYRVDLTSRLTSTLTDDAYHQLLSGGVARP